MEKRSDFLTEIELEEWKCIKGIQGVPKNMGIQ